MSRRVCVGLLFAVSLTAGVLPDQFGQFRRAATGQVQISDRPVWNEYGFQTAEKADYRSAGASAAVSVWQMKDTTGALAALQWLQPGAVQHGNYVLRVEGGVPAADLADLKAKLPNADRSAAPSLPGFLPQPGRVNSSERYILGPVSLAKFEPRISADLAGFHKGAEAQLANYKGLNGNDARLILLSYPTPQIAAERFREFEKRQDLKARRHGPMVGVVLDAPPEAAEKLLAGISYQPNITWSEPVPKNENPGEMIQAIVILAGALMVASLVLGMLFGGLRQVFGSKFGVQAIDDNFTSLHLSDK